MKTNTLIANYEAQIKALQAKIDKLKNIDLTKDGIFIYLDDESSDKVISLGKSVVKQLPNWVIKGIANEGTLSVLDVADSRSMTLDVVLPWDGYMGVKSNGVNVNTVTDVVDQPNKYFDVNKASHAQVKVYSSIIQSITQSNTTCIITTGLRSLTRTTEVINNVACLAEIPIFDLTDPTSIENLIKFMNNRGI